jgi:uncharacterized protein
VAEQGLGARLYAWIQRNLPSRESFERNRWLKPVAHRVLDPALWRMTRRSVPRGVALGMFTGILIPMGQIPASAVLALPLRANVPAAALTTFFTNPFTTPLLLVLYYKAGAIALRLFGASAARTGGGGQGGWLHWLVAEVGLATLVGAVIVAVAAAVLGYGISALAWRIWIARKWRARAARRSFPDAN